MPGDVVTRENLDQLPKTVRGEMAYETEALSTQEAWGPGEGFSELVCRQRWGDSEDWIRFMGGETKVLTAGSLPPRPYLKRYLPEPLKYGGSRKQWCMGFRTHTTGGVASGGAMQDPVNRWPQPDWIKYHARWETPPYAIRTETEIADMISAATAVGKLNRAEELLRYVIRNSKNWTKEQPLPAGAAGTGFKVVSADPALRIEIPTAVAFKAVAYADIAYTWVRVPVGWPPPGSWTAPLNPPYWPPLINARANNPAVLKYARDEYKLRVNDDYFDDVDPDGFHFEPGELKYIGYDDNFKYEDATGARMMDIVYFFRYKRGGWNKFLDNLGNFVEVTSTGISPPGGEPIYKSADFNNLFQYAINPIT